MTGKVSNMVFVKSYGFISAENGQEYFFHKADTISNWDELVSDFTQGGGGKIKVTFDAIKTPKGPRAANVRVVEVE